MLTQLNSLAVLQCIGSKTPDFLQGQFTCDMRLLAKHGDSSFTACCDHRGRMIATFWVVRWHDDFLLLTHQSLALLLCEHLKKYAVFSEVLITLREHFFLAELFNETQKNNDCVMIALPNLHRQLIVTAQNPCPEITLHEDETHWRKNNIQDEIAILCDKTSLLFTPHMIHLEKLGGVSFNKGCYVGQEIVARTHYLGSVKRQLKQITLTLVTPLNAGDSLSFDQHGSDGVVIDAVEIVKNQYDVLAVVRTV